MSWIVKVMRLKFSLSFNVLRHPLYDFLVAKWGLAGRTIDVSSVDYIVNDWT